MHFRSTGNTDHQGLPEILSEETFMVQQDIKQEPHTTTTHTKYQLSEYQLPGYQAPEY